MVDAHIVRFYTSLDQKLDQVIYQDGYCLSIPKSPAP